MVRTGGYNPLYFMDKYDLAFLNDVCSFPLLTCAEEKKYSRLAQKGDLEARQKMFFSNTRLLASRAKAFAFKYRRPDLYLVFFMEGIDGLYEAISRFDASRGCRFSTYAQSWIDQRIRRSEDIKPFVRLPNYLSDWISTFKNAVNVYRQKHYCEPSDSEILEIMGRQGFRKVTPAHIELIKALSGRNFPVSLDSLVTDIPDLKRTEDNVLRRSEIGTVDEIIKQVLSVREQEIIRLRYGLNGTPPMTLNSIGKTLRLTKERVRQIQYIAIDKLKASMKKRGII
jgi:RNA polymerase primary sigma factor